MKTTISLLAVLLLAAACTTKTQETTTDPVAELESGVMASHDSAMMQMGTVMRLQKAVERKLSATDSLLKLTKSNPTLQETQKQGEAIAASLKTANDGMMDWMHGYNGDTLKKLEQAKALEYLKAEKAKIDQVRDLTKKSIADATKFVE